MGIIMYKVINDKKEFYGTIHYTKIAVICFLHVLLFFMPQSFAENDEQNERARYIQERQIIELSKGTPKNIKQEKEERNQQQFSKTTSVYIKKILWLNGEEPPTSVKNILKTYENKKNSGKDLQELLKTINQKIQQEGYITTKVILEPQHIQNGVIYLILQKGMIRDFIYEKELARIQTARIFPEGKGGWLNLRDLEQGVENMTAEKTNMVPEMLLKEKYIVSPVLKGAIKAGGVGIFMTGADVLDAYNKYSGKELLMAVGANLLPIAGAFIGTSSGGFITAGLFATAGDKLKYELLKNVQTRHQKEIDKVVNKFLEGA